MTKKLSKQELLQTYSILLLTSYPVFPQEHVTTFRPLTNIIHFARNGNSNSNGEGAPRKKAMPKRRIMIVDDERDIANIFKSGLERNGFDADIFNDPLAALTSFRPNLYDLLLLDVRMPNMSGFELYNEIRKKQPDVKACFVSAFEVHSDELARYLPGKDEECIIKKPVSMKDLLRMINEELGSKP